MGMLGARLESNAQDLLRIFIVLCHLTWEWNVNETLYFICDRVWHYATFNEIVVSFLEINELFIFICTVDHLKAATHMEFLADLHAEYGQITSFTAGSQRLVFIGDGILLADLFKQDTFSVRPFSTLPVFQRVAHGKPTGKNEKLSNLRKVTLRASVKTNTVHNVNVVHI